MSARKPDATAFTARRWLSAEFDDEALEKRPTVQVGDPFLEKLLLEACLEAMRSGAIAGIQDMGAAGLNFLFGRNGGARRNRIWSLI